VLSCSPVGVGLGQIGYQGGGRGEQHGIPLLDRRAAQGHRQMGFPYARQSSDKMAMGKPNAPLAASTHQTSRLVGHRLLDEARGRPDFVKVAECTYQGNRAMSA